MVIIFDGKKIILVNLLIMKKLKMSSIIQKMKFVVENWIKELKKILTEYTFEQLLKETERKSYMKKYNIKEITISVYFIVYELGIMDLSQFIKTEELDKNNVEQISHQITKAVYCMHKNNII